LRRKTEFLLHFTAFKDMAVKAITVQGSAAVEVKLHWWGRNYPSKPHIQELLPLKRQNLLVMIGLRLIDF
jgi:hypothetical protein